MGNALKAQKPRRILVVEDDEDLRVEIVDLLERHGFEVTEASTGYGALAAMRAGRVPPSVVVLDLWMPEMDGWQLRRNMQLYGLESIPIVVMTAARSQQPESLEVAAVLEKPFAMPRLLEAIERLL
jgi:CheY-like chemotaxis protein